MTAAITYALSDIARTPLFIVPALAFGSLHGGVRRRDACSRRCAWPRCWWRSGASSAATSGSTSRSGASSWLRAAVCAGGRRRGGADQLSPVRRRRPFDAATFAIYAIGCLQIPLFDLIVTSTVNVMMVKMAEDAERGRARRWRSGTTPSSPGVPDCSRWPSSSSSRLTTLIVGLFTTTYAASVPIFMVWALTMLPASSRSTRCSGCTRRRASCSS